MKRKLERGGILAVTAVALAIAMAACGSSSSKSASSGGSSASSASSGGQSKASIPIGQVGGYSGPVPGLSGQGQGLQAWVKATNAAGGVDGHQLKLYTGDSKGDPTTEVSQTLQIASQHKVVAFAGMGLTTVAGVAKYLGEKQIPTIGGNTNDVAFAVSPGFYNPGTGLLGTYLGGFFAAPKGHTKTGLVYCSESAGCTGVYDLMFKLGLSKLNGGDPLYSAKVSLASPSFTAQCLAAKQAGVQTMSVAMDPTNMVRLAKNCQSQGYSPVYGVGGTVASDAVASSGATNGSVAGLSQAPWFLTSGPIAKMDAAMKQYLPSDTVDATTVEGWTAGVALGQAIENYYKANPKANALTSQDITQGLGAVKNDTFGGLTPPVSFTAGGVQPESNCYFSISVKHDKWTESSSKPVCPSAKVDTGLAAALKAVAKG